jgi:hypothetical protein
MEIIDHGVWVQYQPTKPQKDAPARTIYARREADSVDWYDYVRPNFLLMQPPKPPTYHPTTGELLVDDTPPPVPNFKPGSVVCNIFRQREHSIVGAATYDPTAIHSINQRVIEIVDYQGSDPQKDFGGKVYDHATGTFSDQPPLPPSLSARLDAMEKRIKALEARKK